MKNDTSLKKIMQIYASNKDHPDADIIDPAMWEMIRRHESKERLKLKRRNRKALHSSLELPVEHENPCNYSVITPEATTFMTSMYRKPHVPMTRSEL